MSCYSTPPGARHDTSQTCKSAPSHPPTRRSTGSSGLTGPSRVSPSTRATPWRSSTRWDRPRPWPRPAGASSASSSVARCRSPWQPTGSPAPGTSRPASSPPRRSRPPSSRWRDAGFSSCSVCPPDQTSPSSPAPPWRTSSALAAARHDVLGRLGWDVESDGLFGAPPVTVAVGEEAHPSLFKALGMLGLGRDRVVRVPVDGQGRMRADLIPRLGPPPSCARRRATSTQAQSIPWRDRSSRPRAGRLGPRRRRVRSLGGGRAVVGQAGGGLCRTPTHGRPTRTSG